MQIPRMVPLPISKAVLPPDLMEIAHSVEDQLHEVRVLITDRVFREEGFGELLTTTLRESSWKKIPLPDWLAGMLQDPSLPENQTTQMAQHLLAQGGKLFRASLILLTTQALSPHQPHSPKLAAAMELIHLATLLHDDVIDRAEVRRGSASLPMVFDNSPTVLMGDHLFARAFELIAECGHMGIITSSCRATSAMCRGEIEQLQWIDRLDVAEEVYFRLIEMKTAALMASCTESAALLCGHRDTAADWYQFGLFMGFLFQMTDDLLDFTAESAVLGKQVGSDTAAGKYTLPMILFREALGGTDALRSYLETRPTLDHLRRSLESSGILTQVRQRLGDLAQTCREILRNIALHGEEQGEPPLSLSTLDDLVEFVVSRDH